MKLIILASIFSFAVPAAAKSNLVQQVASGQLCVYKERGSTDVLIEKLQTIINKNSDAVPIHTEYIERNSRFEIGAIVVVNKPIQIEDFVATETSACVKIVSKR